MKVYFNLPQNKADSSKSLSCTPIKSNNQTTNTILKTDLANMPNYKYQVSFGAMNSSLESLYKAFGQGKGMPETYNRVLSEMASSAREAVKSVYAHYRSVYAPLEECHSIEAIKKLFPAEFAKIQSALTRKSNNGSFISKVSEWAGLFDGESDKFLFPETKDNDLAVYLAKKLFLEAKTKNEIRVDFFKEINREILNEQDIKKLMITTRGTETIPDSVFAQLGLQGKFEANGFRHSLLRSREDYIQKYGSVYLSKRKAVFARTVEAITSSTDTAAITLPKRGSANYEKSQYAMFDVWNNSMDLKVAMSEFLTGKKSVDEMLIPDLMSIHTLKIRKDETQMQRSLMQQFWAKHPKLREEFSNRCKDSFDRVEKAIDDGRFEELKKEIDVKRQSSFLEMKALKEERERKIIEQKMLAEEKLRIENLNNAIKKVIRTEVDGMRKNIAIPQSEIARTAQYLSMTVKDGKAPKPETLDFIWGVLNNISELSSTTSLLEINKQKEINKNVEPYLRDMIKELLPEAGDNLPIEFIRKLLHDKLDNVTEMFVTVYKKYLLFICNNNSAGPKLKARRQEMERIINVLLQDDSVKEKLGLESQKKFLKAQAFKIAEIPAQEIEKSYTGYYHNLLNDLPRLEDIEKAFAEYYHNKMNDLPI